MTNCSCLYEEQQPSRFLVVPSKKIRKNFDLIRSYNKNNQEALAEWQQFIEFIQSYLSNRSVALDYPNRCNVLRNGALHLIEPKLNIDLRYTIGFDNRTNRNYVFIFKMDYKLDRFGLIRPAELVENKFAQRLLESRLENTIKKIVRNVLKEHRYKEIKRNKYSKYLYSL